MAFSRNSPAAIFLLLTTLLLLSSFFTTGAAASNIKSSASDSSSRPQLFHAVTGNVSAITGVETVTSSKGSQPSTFTFHCFSKRDCAFAGPNATCWNYQCICDLGYISVNATCRPLYCRSSVDCRRSFYNTRCNVWNHSCVCDYGTHLDRYSQTCLFNDDDHLALKISLPISLLFVAILVTCCCCCCCKRRRRRREQQARLLSNPADPNGAMYQAVGGHSSGQYQGGYQNPTLIYPSLNQAPPPYNPAYVQGGPQSAPGWNLPPTTKS